MALEAPAARVASPPRDRLGQRISRTRGSGNSSGNRLRSSPRPRGRVRHVVLASSCAAGLDHAPRPGSVGGRTAVVAYSQGGGRGARGREFRRASSWLAAGAAVIARLNPRGPLLLPTGRQVWPTNRNNTASARSRLKQCPAAAYQSRSPRTTSRPSGRRHGDGPPKPPVPYWGSHSCSAARPRLSRSTRPWPSARSPQRRERRKPADSTSTCCGGSTTPSSNRQCARRRRATGGRSLSLGRTRTEPPTTMTCLRPGRSIDGLSASDKAVRPATNWACYPRFKRSPPRVTRADQRYRPSP
jgi:hypothetical protein